MMSPVPAMISTEPTSICPYPMTRLSLTCEKVSMGIFAYNRLHIQRPGLQEPLPNPTLFLYHVSIVGVTHLIVEDHQPDAGTAQIVGYSGISLPSDNRLSEYALHLVVLVALHKRQPTVPGQLPR